MLRQRLLTALLLIPLVIGAVLWLDNRIFAVAVALVVLLGAREMARLANLGGPAVLSVYLLAVLAAMGLAWRFLQPPQLVAIQWLMAAWWILVTAMLVARRTGLLRIASRRTGIAVVGGLVLVTAWVSIVQLHAAGPNGPALVLFLFVLIWVADSGAYFAGRAFGRRKLAPFVSPGKTWAGAIGAGAGAVLSGMLLRASGLAGEPPVLAMVGLCVLVTAVSVGGDLWESRLKREAGVKDSGDLLPGHGGVLDRIDSLLAAAPVFALGIGLVGVTA